MPQEGKSNVDDRLLMALACGASVEAAARSVDVSESTVYRRLRQPEFRQKLQALRTDMIRRTTGMLTAAATEGVRTLLTLLKDAAPAAVRLGAARAVLEIGMKVREATELEERIAALEERLGAEEAQAS